MKSHLIPDTWGAPAKNWLKQRAGLVLNEAAFQWVWAEVVRRKPEPTSHITPGTISTRATSHPTRSQQSGFSAQALRLANIPQGPYDPRNVERNTNIGATFRNQRQHLVNLLMQEATRVWGHSLAPEYLHWLRLEFLLDSTPDKRRGLPMTQWLSTWPDSLRSATLAEYNRLEEYLRRYDDPIVRGEETKAWKRRERSLFRTLWEDDSRSLWNHRTLTGTLALMSLRRHGTLTYWNPWDFATILHHDAAPPLSAAQQAQMDAWFEGCISGRYDPNDPEVLKKFLSTWS